MSDLRKKIRELTDRLNMASKAYYAQDREVMSNLEYDRLYDELQKLEKETGIVMADSPTVNVGYEAVDDLPKERHAAPMLSLDKTKDRETLRSFIGGHKTLLSWKMDGLTIVLTYQGGKLQKAVTRGNGTIGEVVTNNAKVFKGLPLKIPFMGELVIRGEAYITYSDFEKINGELDEDTAKYKNPRNLCSGSVRQLNNEVTAKRNVRLNVFSLVSAEGADFGNSHEKQFIWLKEQGFSVVEYRAVTADTMDEAMDYFAGQVLKNDFPSDGLVALYDDIAYGEALGNTAKFPRNAFAFKWADEMKTTSIREIEWSPSRTGLLNPVAVFDPIELEGSTVSRASVHNVSIVKELALGTGDEVRVYKANMIIPQIAENLTRSGNIPIPDRCPVCGGAARIHTHDDTETLYCTNPECPAKHIKAFTLFVSRDALNIDGLSESTLEKMMAHGLVHDFADLYHIDQHRDIITSIDGLGEKSYENLQKSIRNSRRTTISRLLYGLGIPNIGVATARMISRAFGEDMQKISNASPEDMQRIEGIGEVTAGLYTEWWAKQENRRMVDMLLPELDLQKEFADVLDTLKGKTFVITGSLVHFENRNALKEAIEKLGGKVAGSVSKKTEALINNDAASASSKNRKAGELGIPILSEEAFMEMYGVRP